MIDILEAEIEALADMSSSFLDLVRLESGRKQYNVNEFDIRDLLIECHEIVINEAHKLNILFILDLPDTLPRIRGDRKQLKQAFINLLNNAVKFNKVEGEIILKAKIERDHIMITISDTGLGIPEDEQSKIFEKFYRVKSHRDQVPGTGLGLSVVRQIILGHGGEINFTSKVNTGTTFTITLPND
jgi:two-component system phosphate regulon sensor histidine kinase PhoR